MRSSVDHPQQARSELSARRESQCGSEQHGAAIVPPVPSQASDAPATSPPASAPTSARGIIAFLAIAFGLAWVFWIPGLLLGAWKTNVLLMVVPGAFAPAVAAIVTHQWITHEGFADAGLRPHLRRRWPYYLIAWLWPLPIIAASVALVVALEVGLPGSPLQRGALAVGPLLSGVVGPALGIALLATPVFWGEEFGWRGYLQIRLFGDRPVLAAVATGLIWGVWHYPAILAGYVAYDNALMGMTLFPLILILISIVLGWLRLRTGSVWAPSLGHAALNMISDTLAVPVFATAGSALLPTRGALVMIPLGLLCAWIVFSGQLKPETVIR